MDKNSIHILYEKREGWPIRAKINDTDISEGCIGFSVEHSKFDDEMLPILTLKIRCSTLDIDTTDKPFSRLSATVYPGEMLLGTEPDNT